MAPSNETPQPTSDLAKPAPLWFEPRINELYPEGLLEGEQVDYSAAVRTGFLAFEGPAGAPYNFAGLADIMTQLAEKVGARLTQADQPSARATTEQWEEMKTLWSNYIVGQCSLAATPREWKENVDSLKKWSSFPAFIQGALLRIGSVKSGEVVFNLPAKADYMKDIYNKISSYQDKQAIKDKIETMKGDDRVGSLLSLTAKILNRNPAPAPGEPQIVGGQNDPFTRGVASILNADHSIAANRIKTWAVQPVAATASGSGSSVNSIWRRTPRR